MFLEDDYENPEFAALLENFRSESTKLLDMLDVSSPVVARLKVKEKNICLTLIKNIHNTSIFIFFRKCSIPFPTHFWLTWLHL